MRKLKIEPKGVVNRYNAETGERGECSELVNMRERNGALETVGVWNVAGRVPAGTRLMLIDRRKEGDYYISCVGAEVYLCGCMKGGDFLEENTLICSFEGEVQWLQSVGHFVVACTTQGYRYLRYVSGGYVRLDVADMIPQLIFDTVNTTVVSETIVGDVFATDYSEWKTLADKDFKKLKEKVLSAHNSLNERAKLSGAYMQPVAVRYAVRLWDGSYAWISAPVIVGNGVQLSSMISAQVDSDVSSYADSVLSCNIFNIGATVIKSPSQDWLPLIKSVDILVSEEMSPFMDDELRCRCETSGATRYLSFGLREKDRQVSSAELLNPTKWRVLTSISDMNDLDMEKPNTVLRSDLFSESLGRNDVLQLVKNINHDVISNAGISLRGKLYSGGNVHRMRNVWSSVQYWGGNVTGQPCKVMVTARLRTEQGTAIKVDNEEYDYTPQRLNALISYPDSRAEELTIKVLCGDNITEWSGKLAGCDEQGYAYFLNSEIEETELSAGCSFYALTEQNIDEWNGSEMTVSVKENPFVVEQRRRVGQGDVKCLAPVYKSIYSSVFGRYPVYAFTSEGIYAVSYKEKGDYNDVQLIDRRLLENDSVVAMSSDKVFFIDESEMLCSVSGKDVKELSSMKDVAQIVWVRSRNELLLLHGDGSMTEWMKSGRTYKRDVEIKYLYGDYRSAYAFDSGGKMYDLNDERNGVVPVLLETYPFAPVDDEIVAPILFGVNVSGKFVELGTLELIGSDGVECSQSSVMPITLSGHYCHPMTKRVYMRPCRLLKMKFSGKTTSGTLIRDFHVKYC